MNQATKLTIELLEDHAEAIYSQYCYDELLLSETATKYFLDLVERKIEDDLYSVLLQEVTHLIDWDKVSEMIFNKNICYK